MAWFLVGVAMARIVVCLLLLSVMTSCTEYGYRMNELYGLNCRPGALQDGHRVAVTIPPPKGRRLCLELITTTLMPSGLRGVRLNQGALLRL